MQALRVFLVVSGLTVLGVSPALAVTITLDFNPAVACAAPCVNSLIDQSYGDITGVVDVTYTGRDGIGNTTANSPSLLYWATGYTGLTDVAWTSTTDTGEIAFAAPAGALITFNSLDLGNWQSTLGGATSINIYNGAYTLLASPEPATLLLLGAGLVALSLRRRVS